MSYCPKYRSYRITLADVSAVDLVPLADVKEHLRIDHSDEDDYITMLIDAAIEWAESYTSWAIRKKTFVDVHDGFSLEMPLRWGGVTSIEGITYQDEDNAEQTLSTAIYVENITTGSQPSKILKAYNQDFPTVYGGPSVVEIEYIAGYATSTALPKRIKQAVFLTLAKWYEQREDDTGRQKIRSLPTAAETLLNTFRIWEI